jgi:pyrroloquinoline quinone biosynthesis protein A
MGTGCYVVTWASVDLQSPRLLSPNAPRILFRGLEKASLINNESNLWRTSEMKWETPSYTDLRFGFEVTMYIYNR